MIVEQKLNFRKVRDLGDKIEFTFSFWAKNFKQIFIASLIICGPFMLIGSGMMSYVNKDFMLSITQGDVNDVNETVLFTNPIYLIGYLVNIFSLFLINSMAISMVQVYIDDKEFSLSTISSATFQNLGKVFGGSMIYGIIFFIGFLLFLFPGIYALIAFSLLLPVLVWENRSVGDALSRSRKLISDNWWSTFVFYFILGIIISVASSLILGGADFVLMIQMALGLVQGGELSAESTMYYVPLKMACSMLMPVFYVLYNVGTSVQYFSLVEKKDAATLKKEIEELV